MTQFTTDNPYFPQNLEDYAPWVAKHGLLQPYGKCQCGCGDDAPLAHHTEPKHGVIKDRPQRFLYNHHNRIDHTEERFWAKVSKAGPNDCWEWQGARTKTGYGCFQHKGRQDMAHRASYELHNGPIPPDHYICHTCDNPSCVNPAHLFLGTPTDNVQDMIGKGRRVIKPPRGEAHPHARLTGKDVVNIRKRYAHGCTIQSLADEYNVSYSCIDHAINRRTWRHIP